MSGDTSHLGQVTLRFSYRFARAADLDRWLNAKVEALVGDDYDVSVVNEDVQVSSVDVEASGVRLAPGHRPVGDFEAEVELTLVLTRKAST